MPATSSSTTPRPLLALRSPTVEEWQRMSPAQRDAIEEELYLAALRHDQALRERMSEEERAAMAESDAHGGASWDSRGALRAFFRRTGSNLYIACNMAVFYPGETHFEPDLLAVRDVPSRKRDSYVVLKEGKGLDLVIEILYKGMRRKDLSDNPEHYARLGIPEYFVVDLRRGRIHGFHLASPDARRYAPLLGDRGRYRSAVLGLDLAIEKDELRFYAGTAAVPLLEELADAAEERAAAAEEAMGAAREQARADLVRSILTILQVRGLALTDEQRENVQTCQDVDLPRRWFERAATAPLDELFVDS